MTVWNIIYVAAAVIILFGAAVFVHEFGHFWMARRRGMKVEAFAIGFGPKLFGWTRDGIEYAWRAIPAGGYVKLPQMTTAAMLEGTNEAGEKIPPASAWSKILVAFAGPFMNLVFGFVIATLIYFVGLPVLVNPPIIGYVEPSSEEARLGIQEGDRIVRVDGQKIKSWQDITQATVLARTNVLPVVIERNGAETTYQLATEINDTFGLKLLRLDARDHPEVTDVLAGTAAEKAGLRKQDKIIAFAGVPIVSRDQLIDLIKKRPEKPSEINVERAGRKITLAVTPTTDPTTGKGRIGVALGTSTTQVYVVQRPGPTPWISVSAKFDQILATFGAVIHFRQTGVTAKDLSGPVGILSILAVWVNTDYRLALDFLVLLNVGLAVFNLLPIPVLDGGHIFLSLIEKVRRRPLNAKFVEYVTTAFAVVLISFMLYVTFFDIKRMPIIGAWFKSKAQIEQPEVVPAPGK